MLQYYIINIVRTYAWLISPMYTVDPAPVSYTAWLKNWKDHLTEAAPLKIQITASKIHTPLIVQMWEYHLWNYPNRELVQFFLEGITQGFRIRFITNAITLKSATRNLQGQYSIGR